MQNVGCYLLLHVIVGIVYPQRLRYKAGKTRDGAGTGYK